MPNIGQYLIIVSTLLVCNDVVVAHSASVQFDTTTGNYLFTYQNDDGDGGPYEAVFVPSTKLVPAIRSAFAITTGGQVEYSYTLLNSGLSQQAIWSFQLEPLRSITASEQLMNLCLADWRSNPRRGYLAKAGKDALRKPAGWGGAVTRSTNVICSDLADPVAGLSVGWDGYGDAPGSEVVAGETQADFGYQSLDLPGLSQARVRGNGDPGQWPESGPHEPTASAKLSELMRDDYVGRVAAAPIFFVSNPFNGTALLAQFREHFRIWPQQALIDQALWQKIDGLLAAAISAVGSNNKPSAASSLIQVRVELRKKYPDLDMTTTTDDPKASDLPATPEALKPLLSAHDQRLAAKVLDFDVGFVITKIGAGALPGAADGTIVAPPADADGSFGVTWGRPVSKLQTVCGTNVTDCRERIVGYALETATNSNFVGSRVIYDGPSQEYRTDRLTPGTHYFRVKAHMEHCTVTNWFSGEGGDCFAYEQGISQIDTGYYALGPNITVISGQP